MHCLTQQAHWSIVALALLGFASATGAEESSADALSPAPVSLPDTYAPPTRAEIESILQSAVSAHSARLRPLRIVLCASEQDKGHAAPELHNYPIWRERWSKLLALGEGLIVETADRWPTPAQWRKADIVVLNSDNSAWASEPKGSARIAELGRDIDTFLARGGGLVFIHFALNGGANFEALAHRLGLAWVGVAPYSKGRHHAAQWQLDKTHPLAAGLSRFRLPDESYWNLAGDLEAAGARLLMSSPEEGAFRPQMWTRQVGGGRVFVSVPGHFVWTYDDPLYRILVFRGMMWSARQPIDRLAPLVPIGARFGDASIPTNNRSMKTDSVSWAAAHPQAGNVTPKRLLNADKEPGEWLTGGRDYRQNYYSPLAQINRSNVQQVGFAWAYDIDSSNFQATPIVVDGIMFTSGRNGAVYALDAKTGVERWTFDPVVDPDIFRKSCCGGVNRGVAVWRGKVFVASVDAYLYALDANTGAVVWKVDTVTDRTRAYSSSGAPYIAKDLVVIGNSGAEFDARGYITAYHTDTGKQAWRFFTVPGDPKYGFEHPELEMAAKTWDPNSRWEVGLGGTVWDGMAYDPELKLLYVGTGNGVPWNRFIRSPAGGDNLFLCSILAINPDTGRLKWHYQTVPGENWDLTSTQKLVLAELKIKGKTRKVIMQAPKNGFFYVLDRATGDLLSAEPYAIVTWASHVDMKTGKPVETEQSDYSKEPKMIFPGPIHGAHNWQPMAFSPETGLVYIPVAETPAVFKVADEPFEYKKGQNNVGTIAAYVNSIANDLSGTWPPIDTLAAGQDHSDHLYLRAWDPVRQRTVWEVETTGLSPVSFGDSGGAMATAGGLVFQGRKDGWLYVYDASTGVELHRIDLNTSMKAAPMTYSVGGDQYVAIMAGVYAGPGFADFKYGNKGRIVALKLGGGPVPKRPEIDTASVGSPPPVSFNSNPKQLESGEKHYQRTCAVCHEEAGRAPDLTLMSERTHKEFMDIVLKGLRVDKGMGNFSAVLSADDAKAVHAYIVNSAWKKYWARQSESLPHAESNKNLKKN